MSNINLNQHVFRKPLLSRGGICMISGVMGALLYSKYIQDSRLNLPQKQLYVQTQLENDQKYCLQDDDCRILPWYSECDLPKWEYKLISLQGYFDENRIFVRRQRNGQDGYLVFAPFLTAIDYMLKSQRNVKAKPAQCGIMVNMGWVPLDKKDEISTEPPCEPIEFNNEMFNQTQQKMISKLFIKDEEELRPMYEIKGILKKGEKQSIWNRRVNWEKQGNFNFIDLFFMARFFRLFNMDAASQAYIELIADEADEESYPIPSTKDTFQA